MKNRTTFLVDGFNLYHSVRTASHHLGGQSTKWLDIPSLLSSYLSAIGSGATIEEIYYFSALATHLDPHDPGVTARHQVYIKALLAHGVIPLLARFKPKTIRCPACRTRNIHHEEKETDVAISVKFLETLFLGKADTVVLVTGDTDIAPAVRSASQLFPQNPICFIFPYRRKNNELAKLAHKSFTIRKERYCQHQFPDHVALPDGKSLKKPPSW